MSIKPLILLISFPLLCASVFCQTSAQTTKGYQWESIVPLVTKKSEIEKSFGKPAFAFENGVTYSYDTDFGKLGVQYRGTGRLPGALCDWNIEPEVVVWMRIGLKEAISILDFKYDLSAFEKQLGHNKDFVYFNEEIGISVFGYFDRQGKEWVSTIYHYPTTTEKKSKCVAIKLKG